MLKQSKTPIIDHVTDFLEYCEVEKGLAATSVRNYDNFLKVFVEWLERNKLAELLPHQLTPEHIWDFRLFLSKKEDKHGNTIKKTTQNYYLIAVRNLVNYFIDKDIQSLPSEKIKLPKLTDKDKAIKFLKFEQVKRLFDMPDTSKPDGLRDRAILETLFSTGMRVSELTSLNIRQLDTPRLLKGSLEDTELSISGKGGKVRVIYFSERALKWLVKYLRTRQDMYAPLFINYHKNDNDDEHRLTPRSVERLVRKYCTMAGLPVDATPHTLRHSFATDLLGQGADMRSVQELLGHKNIMTTQIYTHVTNPKLHEMHKKYHRGNKD